MLYQHDLYNMAIRTKKDILAWYLQRGEIARRGEINDYDDLMSKPFHPLMEIGQEQQEMKNGKYSLVVWFKRGFWKHRVELWFSGKENFRIVGF